MRIIFLAQFVDVGLDRGQVCAEILFPFLWVSGCVVSGDFPAWCLLAWLAAFPAIRNVRTAVRYFREGAAAISVLDVATAQLQMVFSIMLAASFILTGLVR